CPAPPPRRDNIRYYANAAAAEAAGFRPCLRCRPELAPHGDVLRHGDSHIAQALRLIDAGVLEQHSLAELARQLAL
ncbi:Ada DNA repair, metal-binding domain protein, partial [mine drainage metagenome]